MRARFSSYGLGLWHSLVAAFQLLSRIPLPLQVPFHESVLRRSTVFFPAVGLVIGLALAGAGAVLTLALPAAAAAALLAGLWVALTGGLHMDGLMDTADGLLSGRSRERMLEIMKDSRVGAMGVMAGVLQALFKFSFLMALLELGWGDAMGPAAAVPIWSRWFMVAAIAKWPYAREGQGLGAMFAGAGFRELLGSTLLAAGLSIIWLAASGMGFRGAALLSAAAAFITGAAGTLLAKAMARKLGGLTGDTYGALCELLESFLLLGVVFFCSI